MKVPNKLQFQLKDLGYVTSYIKEAVAKEWISIASLSDAPLWLRIMSRGDYCAYKNTVYVPSHHYSLVSSKSVTDRNLSTAKLCKWFMAIHDYKNISFPILTKLLYNNKYTIHYFLYEFFFLSGSEHPYKDLITLGFLSSRRTWYGRRINFEVILSYANELMLRQTPSA